jgi:hypothetical protein
MHASCASALSSPDDTHSCQLTSNVSAYSLGSCAGSTDTYIFCSRLQELEIFRNFQLTGSSLKGLPRCCPGLRVLRLQQLPWLEGGFLPALQQLEVCCSEHAWLISVAAT